MEDYYCKVTVMYEHGNPRTKVETNFAYSEREAVRKIELNLKEIVDSTFRDAGIPFAPVSVEMKLKKRK